MICKWPHSVWPCRQNLLAAPVNLAACRARFVPRPFAGGSTSNAFSASVDTSQRRPAWLRIGQTVDGGTPEIARQPRHGRVPDRPDTIEVLCNTSSDRPRFPTQFDPIVSRLFGRTNQHKPHIPLCGSASSGVNPTQACRHKIARKHTTQLAGLCHCRNRKRGPALS